MQKVHLKDLSGDCARDGSDGAGTETTWRGPAGRGNESLDNDLSFDPAKCCFRQDAFANEFRCRSVRPTFHDRICQLIADPRQGRELFDSRLIEIKWAFSSEPFGNPTRDSTGIALCRRRGIGGVLPQRVRVVWREAACE